MSGQGWQQIGELALAFLLSALVGLEREVKHKAAGLRTYTLVGVAAALFTIISKHGFDNVLRPGLVVLDPSRVAAQIVSGLGFIGGGVIFMRRDVVRGLTTAASVWLTAALGMACGAGLPVLAVATSAGHFIIMFAFPKLTPYLPHQKRVTTQLRVTYAEGGDMLQRILLACSQTRFAIERVDIAREEVGHGRAELVMEVRGKPPASQLVLRLAGLSGVVRVDTLDEDAPLE